MIAGKTLLGSADYLAAQRGEALGCPFAARGAGTSWLLRQGGALRTRGSGTAPREAARGVIWGNCKRTVKSRGSLGNHGGNNVCIDQLSA